MARMKKCPKPNCGHLNSVGELYCDNCKGSLSDDDVIDCDEQSECPIDVERPAEDSISQPSALDVDAFLEFPWGLVKIGRLFNVGRDPDFSPIAVEIHDNHVSGRHAELRWERGRLMVRHVGKSNPTYVNSRELATGEEVAVGDWDRISFSSFLTAVVRLKRTR